MLSDFGMTVCCNPQTGKSISVLVFALMQPIEAAQNFETEKVLHGLPVIPICIVGVQ